MALGGGGIFVDPKINPAYSGTFIKSISTAPTVWDRLCTTRTSTKHKEYIAIGGRLPSVRQFAGSRQPGTILELQDEVTHTKYELSIEVDTDRLGDDQSGEIQAAIGQLGSRLANYRNKRVLGDMLDNVEVTTSRWGGNKLDSQSFCDTDHAWTDVGGSYGTSQNNDITAAAATGTAPTLAEFKTYLRDIRSAFHGFKDDNGEPYYEGEPMEKLILIVPYEYEEVALEAAQSTRMPDGSGSSVDNITNQGKVEVVVNQYRGNGDRFFAVAASAAGDDKPFLMSQRQDVELSSVRPNDGSYTSWSTDMEYYGGKMRFDTRFASWPRLILFTVT